MPDTPVNRLTPHHWQRVATPPTIGAHYGPRSLVESKKPMDQRLQEFMGEHPKITVAAAAAVGLLLGWMVKRK